MVREQEPARAPLTPAKGNAPANPLARLGAITTENPTAAVQEKPVQRTEPTEAPQFGRPTPLGQSPQRPFHTQPLVRAANVGALRQVSDSKRDDYSNLFLPSKNSGKRPEASRPQEPSGNPPSQVKNWAPEKIQHSSVTNSSQLQLGQPATQRPPERDFFEIPRPANFPTWQSKPAAAPLFSSQTYSNPYFQNNPVIDLTESPLNPLPRETVFNDRFGAADPYTYVDSVQANENIKALLEGAFEDEDDKPRTRRRKKQLEEKADELAGKLKTMTVEDEGHKIGEIADGEGEMEEDDGTVEGLKVKLLPHQIDGVAWMSDKELGTKKTRGVLPKGGILADDMGLGKTIQSLALMLINPKPSAEEQAKSKRKLLPEVGKGTLVVAPLALIKQWEGEIRDRVEVSHALSVCVHHGPQRAKSFKDLKNYDVVITTYQTLSSEHASSEGGPRVGCFGLHWYRVILDEAHSIKNRNAKATKATCALDAEYRWCLTGTPMQNNLDELQSLIHFLRIKPYDDLAAWRDQITRPMNNGRGGLAIKRLQIYLKAFMKRRTKDVLKQEGALKNGADGEVQDGKSTEFKIVKRTVEKIEVDFTPEERAFYRRLESRTDKSLEQMMAGNKVNYASALVLLLRLRQACNHPSLIAGDLAKENDAFTNVPGSQTPSRRKAAADDMDSIADMLGGLSVETKRCDVCQIELNAQEAKGGAVRCEDCEGDLEGQAVREAAAKKQRKEKKRPKEVAKTEREKSKIRRVIEDSDDEDGEDQNSSSEESEEFSSAEDEGILSTNPVISTKITHLLNLLRRDSHRHKYIVFSFFTSMLDLIEPFLHQRSLRFTRYDGAMRNDKREASLEKLRTDASTRILLCSLRAGSLGLNLTAASRVVILEPFWNPFVEEQAIDRVHRLNQTRDVVVYKLTIRDSVEERILDLQERKRELANATIEGLGKKGAAAAAQLTLQDMLKLFRHDAESVHGIDGIGLRDRGGLLREQSSLLSAAPGNAGYSDVSGVGWSSSSSREASASAPVRQQPKKREEHQVYGRRW